MLRLCLEAYLGQRSDEGIAGCRARDAGCAVRVANFGRHYAGNGEESLPGVGRAMRTGHARDVKDEGVVGLGLKVGMMMVMMTV